MLSIHLEIRCERVREPHVTWKGTEYEVAKLNAVWWDDITESIMIVTQKLWEVMQQDQKDSQGSLNKTQPLVKHMTIAMNPISTPESKMILTPCTGFA